MEIVIKSLASAVVTGIVLILAKFFGPRVAGAIAGVPIVFAISYIMVTMNNHSSSKEFLIGGIYGAIAAIFFSVLLIWFNHQFPKYYCWCYNSIKICWRCILCQWYSYYTSCWF